MMEVAVEKISRREQILDAAFSLLQNSDRWSLAEIAAKIGVSKTAIYRHFKNRADIEEAMDAHLARDLLDVIEESGFTPEKMRSGMVEFLRSHPGHLFLIMYNNLAKPDYENHLNSFLEKESRRTAAFSSYLKSLPPAAQNEIMIAILKNTVSILIASFLVPRLEPMQKELFQILGAGLPKLNMPSDQRLAELEKICRLDPGELSPGNKFFDAIASSIKEYGIQNTTIERIAEKMGSAKSSLYFYFKNKNVMLDELIKKETETIIALCSNRAIYGENFAEQMFIIMEVQASYLLLKPEILAVFNWIRYDTMRQRPVAEMQQFDIDALVKPYHIENILPAGKDQKKRAIGLLKWASILSTSTIIQGLRQKAGEDMLRKNITVMFKSMMNGDKAI